ncbi:helix-turn-helix domain-containing protein [Nonomuraea sp. NPDC049480]|uniref:helix-turn-helix domain-containing protein n=1 Tax=Nonomuraea sp. NPDC049480 TaxID=3364353 RepID=UPI00379989A9
MSEENVALRIAWEMRRRGWSQERMAQEMTEAGCPTHQSAISKIVNPKPDGSRRSITMEESIALAKVFRVPLEELAQPIEAAEGRMMHDLGRAVKQGARDTMQAQARFLLLWARMRYRLSQEETRVPYEEFLRARQPGTAGRMRPGGRPPIPWSEAEFENAIQIWLDDDKWQSAVEAYKTLTRTNWDFGTGRDIFPPMKDHRERHSVVGDLLSLRGFFKVTLATLPSKDVAERIDAYAGALVRADLLEVAAPVLDAYLSAGHRSPADDVVAEIEKRLQEIIDRDPADDLDRLESLAARIGLAWRGGETTEETQEMADDLGVDMDDFRKAMSVGRIYRDNYGVSYR